MNELIHTLADKFPHLSERQFAAEVWAHLCPNRYDHNAFLKKYWSGEIPNEQEINNIRYGEAV